MSKTTNIFGLIVAATLMVLSSAAGAEDLSPEHIKAAKAALAASSATDKFDNILPAVAQKVKSDIIAARPDLADVITAVVDEETLKLAARRGDLENESASIYGRAFNEDELRKISKFYASDTGQKLLKEAPVLTRALNSASKIWASGIVRDLNQAVDKKMKEKGIK